MRLGIDAINLRAGGGLTYLREMLAAADPPAHGIERVVVWATDATHERLPRRPWLEPRAVAPRVLAGGLPAAQRALGSDAERLAIDVLFAPGGTFLGRFAPLVAASQNLLPFEPRERRRFGASWPHLRYVLLEHAQRATFRRAAGVVFLSETARRVVLQRTGPLRAAQRVIPLGVADAFADAARERAGEHVAGEPFRWLYVSIVNVYKHQWHVAEAAAHLRARGVAVEVDFVGPAYPPALRRFEKTLDRLDPVRSFLRYHGAVPYEEIARAYSLADGFVFASSCENLPSILLEAMAAGLPIACSDRGPMPEVLGDAGLYFDPEDPASIARAMERLVAEPVLRARCAVEARRRAAAFTWARCARETMDFLRDVAAGARDAASTDGDAVEHASRVRAAAGGAA